jgi:F0F1-type ATP synthase membrane subunit c/vacuolar-type H+-ATPase subunit K
MILLGFRYLASSIPLIVFAGVGIGVGMIFSFLLNSMARNPLISNSLVR